MESFSSGINVLRFFVYVGCLAMLIIQIVLSGKDYFSHKSVSTIQKISVQDIEFPHIFVCHKKAFNISGKELFRLVNGFDAAEFIGWSGRTNLSTETYLTGVANLKNIDNVKSSFRVLDSQGNSTDVQFKKARINYEKGQCYEAIVDKYVNELSFENKIVLTIQIFSAKTLIFL